MHRLPGLPTGTYRDLLQPTGTYRDLLQPTVTYRDLPSGSRRWRRSEECSRNGIDKVHDKVGDKVLG